MGLGTLGIWIINSLQYFSQIGCDFSENLVRICGDRGLFAVRADCLSLPFKSGAADAVVSIAVIHHLGNAERRR